MRRRVSEPGLLYHVLDPNIDEAPTSWIMRIAGSHGVSVRELLSRINIRRERDLDVAFISRSVERLAKGVKLPRQRLSNISRFFELFRRDRWASAWLRNTEDGKGAVGYCPQCLAVDECPYWRAVWRFKYWVVCPAHGRRILDECPHCSAQVTMHAYLQRVQRSTRQPLCTVCMKCGSSLIQAATQPSWASPLVGDLVSLQMAVTSSLLHGGLHVAGIGRQVPLCFLPGMLMAGVSYGTESQVRLDPRLVDDLLSAMRHAVRTGAEGIYPRRRHSISARDGPVWMGSAATLAELALYARFISPSELAFAGVVVGRGRSEGEADPLRTFSLSTLAATMITVAPSGGRTS
jgi:hypothetical protein